MIPASYPLVSVPDGGSHDYRPRGGSQAPSWPTSARQPVNGLRGPTTMKILYKPFGLIVGLIAGLVSQKVFNAVWGIFDKEEPPKPTTQEANWTKVIAAAAVQGVTFRVTRAA